MAFLANFLSYPFLTVQRRLECRSSLATGMFNEEIYNKGRFTACLKQIIQEEGAKSLWKGFSAHLLTVVIFLSTLPMATDFLMEKLPLYIDPEALKEAKGLQAQPQSENSSAEIPGEPAKREYVFDDDDDEEDYD